MSKFQGNDYRHDHFVTPRRIQGYYPDRGNKGAIVGRIALCVILVLLVVAYFSGGNL